MRQARCPTCGNPAELGDQDIVTVCPYCRTCYTVEGATIRENYLIPAYYSSSQAIENLVLWIKKQIGAQEDLPLHLEIASTALDYYPFWHAEVKADSRFTGVGQDATYGGAIGANTYRNLSIVHKEESGSLDRGLTLTYPASPEIPVELLNYPFPTRSRKYFSEAYAKGSGGQIHNGILSQAAAEEKAKADTARILGELISRELVKVENREDKVELLSLFYLHVPIWRLQYKYRASAYRAFVDASTGRIIHATYPISIEHRTLHGSIAIAHIIAGVIIAGLLFNVNGVAALGGLVAFFAVAGAFAARALTRGRAREEAG